MADDDIDCCTWLGLGWWGQETPNEFKSELASFTKLQLTRLEEAFPAADPADGVDADQEGDGYECCWHAPNANLAR